MLKLETLIDEQNLQERIRELAEEINKDYGTQEVIVLCILKGGVMFMTDLVKHLKMPIKMEFMVVSSYGNEQTSSGIVKILKDLDESIEGKHLLIVEDIIDSGYTLAHLRELLTRRNPESIKICTLLDKPKNRTVQVPIDYRGFSIPDEFVIGYGLDYEQHYRNLPYIAVNRS